MSATLTVSAVEQAAMLRHLELQYIRLKADHRDSAVLHMVMTRLGASKVVVLTRLEAFVTLRYLRLQRFRLEHDMAAIEEQRLQGIDGTLDLAHRALDADVTILNDVLRRLWQMLADPPPTG